MEGYILSKSASIISLITVCLLGLVGCVTAFVVGFFPPGNINVGSHWHYVLLFSSSLLVMASPALLLNYYQSKKLKMLNLESTAISDMLINLEV